MDLRSELRATPQWDGRGREMGSSTGKRLGRLGYTADSLLRRSKEARAMAQRVSDPAARAVLLEVAATFEALGLKAEEDPDDPAP